MTDNKNTNAFETRAEVIANMIVTLASDKPVPEDKLAAFRRWLGDESYPEMKAEGFRRALKVLEERGFSTPHTKKSSEIARARWRKLAERIDGMNPDLDHYLALQAKRNAASPGGRPANVKPLAAWRRMVSRVAAVLLPAALIVGGYFAWERRHNGETAADVRRTAAAAFVPSHRVDPLADSVRRIILADGTEVTLNRNATFSYNDSREGELKGEAYFNVAKNPEHPFVIHSEHLTVKVLGTEFTFNTRGENGSSHLALYNGAVELGHAAGTHRLESAGKAFTLDPATQAAAIEDFDTTVKPGWVEEVEEPFNILSLNDIFDLIEKTYGIAVTGRERIDMARRYNFTPDPAVAVETVMSSLEFLHGDFKYTIAGNTIALDKRK